MEKDFGFILIDKPLNISSHGVISRLRKISNIKRIGHAGTLDPLASGLLIVAVARQATREIDRYVKLDKEYEADICFGAETDTYDKEGVITKEYHGDKIKKKELKDILKKFLGEQAQIPPMYSAKKYQGKRLYELARKNIEIERKPSIITIYSLKVLKYKWPNLKLRVNCSSGTYIRSLAFDLGRELNCGAHLSGLRRTKIGKFNVKKAVKLDKLNQKNWKKYLKTM